MSAIYFCLRNDNNAFESVRERLDVDVGGDGGFGPHKYATVAEAGSACTSYAIVILKVPKITT